MARGCLVLASPHHAAILLCDVRSRPLGEFRLGLPRQCSIKRQLQRCSELIFVLHARSTHIRRATTRHAEQLCTTAQRKEEVDAARRSLVDTFPSFLDCAVWVWYWRMTCRVRWYASAMSGNNMRYAATRPYPASAGTVCRHYAFLVPPSLPPSVPMIVIIILYSLRTRSRGRLVFSMQYPVQTY